MSPRKSSRPTVVAIYCPLWHTYPHMDSWKGEGWNEWELLKTAPKRFKNHYQPLKPSWGCFDESDPKWASKAIAIGSDHGIDVFLFDWYWYNGVKIMEEALENGFLKAPNRKRMKFALMWANHDWADYFPPPFNKDWNMWLPIRHSPRDMDRVMDYCVEHYFRQPNYWRVDDRLFFSMFQPRLMIERLGGPAKTRALLAAIDRKLHSRNLPSLHWNAMTWVPKDAGFFKSAGFLSTTTYGVNTSPKPDPKKWIVDYEDVMARHRQYWDQFSKTALPHMPVLTMGWDVTPRTRHDVKWPFTPPRGQEPKYPYMHVCVGNTPKKFEQLCRDAGEYLQSNGSKWPVVFINAWNEWTEGSYLLPEKRYGDGFLKAIENAFGK